MGATYNLFLHGFVFIAGLLWLSNKLLFATHGAIVRKFWSLFPESFIKHLWSFFKTSAIAAFSIRYFPLFFIFLMVKNFAYESFSIPSESMSPTLKVGDFILTNRYCYGVRIPFTKFDLYEGINPNRGDVVVFSPSHLPNKYLVKRIIGIPGDVIRLKDYQLEINGTFVGRFQLRPNAKDQTEQVVETIGGHKFITQRERQPTLISSHGEWIVPEGKYFVMGDNRDNSSDSREWGFVESHQIYGKAERIWMHKDSLFSLPTFAQNKNLD